MNNQTEKERHENVQTVSELIAEAAVSNKPENLYSIQLSWSEVTTSLQQEIQLPTIISLSHPFYLSLIRREQLMLIPVNEPKHD